MNCPAEFNRRRSCRGMTLAELVVAAAIASIIMAVVGALSLYALRSFSAMSNYTELDTKSNLALDRFSYDLRRCTGLVDQSPGASNRWFHFTNANEQTSIKVSWDATARVLTTTTVGTNGTQVVTNLTECDFWDYQLFQQTPVYGTTNSFVAYGTGTRCKLINMTWKCSRQLLGKKWNTESVQTAKIVLRNAR